MNDRLFAYDLIDTPIHRLSGLTKLISFLLLTFAVMFSYDIRVVSGVMIFSIIVLKMSKIEFSQIRGMVLYVVVFLLINAVVTYLFSPEEGVAVYGTRHEIAHLFGRYTITQEQLFYQATKIMKYASVIPLGMIFLLTTHPSEFAAALNRIGVGYKSAFAVSLTLRYFPDMRREYREISLSQQARGLEISKKAGLITRLKGSLGIIVPLIFSSLERIEVISNAMDLRGFGKHKTRTWYNARKMTKGDIFAIVLSLIIFLFTIAVSVFINQSRFYNPFI